jgi:hypothetical protein
VSSAPQRFVAAVVLSSSSQCGGCTSGCRVLVMAMGRHCTQLPPWELTAHQRDTALVRIDC